MVREKKQKSDPRTKESVILTSSVNQPTGRNVIRSMPNRREKTALSYLVSNSDENTYLMVCTRIEKLWIHFIY